MKYTPTTGVVILNYGDPTDTINCVASLETSDDLDLELVVVHNGPEDEDYRRLADALGERADLFASGDNLGYAGGNNLGIARVLEGPADLVWILNPDTVVAPKTLPKLRERLRTVPDCGIVGPRILLPGTPPRIWFDGGIVDAQTGATGHLHQGDSPDQHGPRALDVDYVTGASMLVRRSMIEDIGPLPEQYFLYYEETDWCRRAQRAGWRTMIDQGARMWHHKRSSGSLPQPYYLYYMTRNRYMFARDVLGVDPEIAMKELSETFLAGWRKRVARRAPDWLDSFDDLVDRAHRDAVAGGTGRNDDITTYPGPEPKQR
jgi:GT2 family glycosyltransferase